MQSLTRIEIAWIIRELSRAVNTTYQLVRDNSDMASTIRSWMELDAANLKTVATKLQTALEGNDKRIAIQ